MRINLPKVFSQNDPAWKGKTLGTKGTIGAYGCLMTDIAMICAYYGKPENPDSLNEKLKTSGGYASGNLYVWAALTTIYPDIKYGGQWQTPDALTAYQMSFIREKINAGYPVLFQIDTIPSTSGLDEHWVLAVDYEGDDFMVADPWDGVIKRITSWGVQPQKLIYAYAYYTGNPVQAIETITVAKTDYEKIVRNAQIKVELAKYLDIVNGDIAAYDDFVRVVAGYKSRITDLQTQLNTASAELQNRTDQVGRLKDELIKSEELRGELTQQLNEAIEKVSGVQKIYEDRLVVMQGQVDTIAKEKGELNKQLLECKNQSPVADMTIGQVLVLLFNKIKDIKLK